MNIDKTIAELAAELSRLQNIKSGEPEFPPDCQALVESRTCLNCGKPIAKGHRAVRGNHAKCHKQTLRAIEQGKLTEYEAIELGLFAPKQRAGAKPASGTRLAEILAAKEAGQIVTAAELPPMRPEGETDDSLLADVIADAKKPARKRKKSDATTRTSEFSESPTRRKQA